ncbi:protein YgfX [Pseudomonas baltica]|uniref:protein YgfX n=1 Tax=Pseudomonas baltica TaxID=2762576 RepID=UPI0028A0C8C3|nr:protein YgfX [Pseudomonas baltica]
MSSPSDRFECRWRASRRLLVVCLVGHLLALIACLMLAVPGAIKLALLGMCLAHVVWVTPRHVLLGHPLAVTGLRRNRDGWQLWTARAGWQPVQLRHDSVALPGLVIIRYRRPGQWFSRSVCVPADALPADQHRRLRVRLKFSRRRWAAVVRQADVRRR